LLDEAISWVENAIKRGFLNYPFLAQHDPTLEPLRGIDRFQSLMQEVKHKWEAFEV
jgi:non-specific serine/threonine protein kinase